MFELPESRFRQAVRQGLAAADVSISAALAHLIEHQYPPAVWAIVFHIYSDAFTSGFPVRTYFVDRKNHPCFCTETGSVWLPSFADSTLVDVGHIYSEELEDTFAAHYPEVDTWAIASDELLSWFATHWLNAGGAAFPLVATIAHHDAAEELNLKSGTWQRSGAAFVS
jgi:hypothetical protein